MITTLAAIGMGGAFGAISRYGVNLAATHLIGHGFPWGTLTVNVAGSFVMGIMIALFAHFWQPPEALRLFLVTGFLGGFTTFSTFSLDIVTLFERGEFVSAFLYGSASVLLSIGALLTGMALIRSFSY
ncbi:fluoride efflux transporter CrcB [Nitrosomonas sp.]|uniref:fluoride efflux transporter CrcB n=1 Tax=Nitrosomonas sp. TaxID=42353 RepID=UPI001D9ACC73|nr:fluoride efflux transporter CrcB [Nitrosomonas sp.]MCB1948257.1 fluoride efflux transporter CrcB [Nitrosomonas sp.]MCP5243401.1 fluoride efflux transporter CrcB [Burkholderiales bacterium]MDR4514843.1 fluoride efflux transporter CrcB [Nitrosomonas sp.]